MNAYPTAGQRIQIYLEADLAVVYMQAERAPHDALVRRLADGQNSVPG